MHKLQNPFSKTSIAVIGDVMLDKYIFGEVERISPEAPVPITLVTGEKFVPGGAANTAANVATLGGRALLFGLTGADEAKDVLVNESKKFGINVRGLRSIEGRRTTQKIRVLGQSQQLLRIDYEELKALEVVEQNNLVQDLKAATSLNAVLVSDYAKGLISENLMKHIFEHCHKNNILVFIDPKPDHQAWYRGAFMITPNRKEAEAMVGYKLSSHENVLKAGKQLQANLGAHILITLGDKGMCLFEKNQEALVIQTEAREVYDVSGAGDTAVAALCLGYCSGMSLRESAVFANKAAGIKVGKLGTAPVRLEEIPA